MAIPTAHLLPADHDRARRVVEAAFSGSRRVTDVSPASASVPAQGADLD
jgi:hypothetical protein